ncbi:MULTISPECIES: AlpA family phage regulatory protein [Acinetobacter]|uniref:Prophage CP4-57 regulatory family protein n=2 Tax=Acinetobacter TaxID=469 RepID=A0A009HI53_ACIB9|nr:MULTISPECIES: AlpA family phage regulatory protein [Acinetobacter]HCJ6432864.1 AlpA family phage regulatory protein [Acinetobacter baumannii]EXB03877.1 prophage CP4-57 regulatory family protein [Acinetobacter baumannii 1295743]MBC68964.1 AlpA family phage regulatory protein [Acinetobacter sp.]MBT49730.1 AlpA family phage regulatory protein [Acinetobacter sp.]SJX22613.1 Prophage CP4-57 regulatory protein (AlpA) [Acinetobacter johnsonii]
MNTSYDAVQMLKLPQLIKLIGLSRSSVYDRLNPRSKRYDPDFPKPVKLNRASRWLLSEVEEWIESKISTRNQGNTES